MSFNKFKNIFLKENNQLKSKNQSKQVQMDVYNIDLSKINKCEITHEQLVLIARVWMSQWITGFEIKYINKYYEIINNKKFIKFCCLCHNGAMFNFTNKNDFNKNLFNEFEKHFNLMMFKTKNIINYKIGDNTFCFQFNKSFNNCFSNNSSFFNKFFYNTIKWNDTFNINYEKDLNLNKKIFAYLMSNDIIKNVVLIINI